MLCENCGKREATTHIKQVENGKANQYHFCNECARNLGYNDIFGEFSLNLSELFSSFFGDNNLQLADKEDRCEKCGCSFNDIVKTGRVGCADCYRKFYDKLLPSIQRIHGKANHLGKTPINTERKKRPSKKEIVEKLNLDMQKAVEQQNFEEAAVLRDRIRQLKEGK